MYMTEIIVAICLIGFLILFCVRVEVICLKKWPGHGYCAAQV